MKAYLPFGDWSGDGHGRYDDILVDINSMDDLLMAQEKIKQQYGKTFFKNYANAYDTPQLSKQCWQALIDHHMPVDILEDSEMLYPDDDGIYNIQDYLHGNVSDDRTIMWFDNYQGYSVDGYYTVGYTEEGIDHEIRFKVVSAQVVDLEVVY